MADPSNDSGGASGSAENISVSVRIRPLNRDEQKQGSTYMWEVDGNTITSQTSRSAVDPHSAPKSRVISYAFDHVFGPDVSTDTVYDTVGEPIVWATMNGFNGTIFAYGQTASGKTHTMMGKPKTCPGIIPLAIQDIFSYIRQTPNREFLLRVSYLEIYNEVINDLLAPNNTNLKIHESPRKGVFVENLKEEIVVSPQQVMSLLAAGEAHRHVGATNFNETSSRSHTLFQMTIESKELSPPSLHKSSSAGRGSGGGYSLLSELRPSDSSPVLVSVLNLIDLAGSEKADASDKVSRRREGAYINKSLLTLGTVISKLSKASASGTAAGHIPYRDSKLTRILEPSLKGNAKIAIIATISPTLACFEESHNTLKFANRAKEITARATINEIVDDKALIKRYQAEISELKRQLASAKEAEQALTKLQEIQRQKQKVEETNDSLRKKLAEQEQLRVQLEEKIRRLTKLILVSSMVDPPSPATAAAPLRSHSALTARGAAARPRTLTYSPPVPTTPTAPSPLANGSTADRRPSSELASASPEVPPLSRAHDSLGRKHRRPRSASIDSPLRLLSFEEVETAVRMDKEVAADQALLSPRLPLPIPPTQTAVDAAPPPHSPLSLSTASPASAMPVLRPSPSHDFRLFTEQIDTLKRRLQERDSEVDTLSTTLTNLQVKQEQLQQQAEQAERTIEDLRRQLKAKDNTIATLLEVKTVQSRDDVALLRSLLEDKYAQQIKQLQLRIEERELELVVLKADKEHLSGQLREKETMLRECMEMFEAFERKQKLLEEENSALRSKLLVATAESMT